LQEGPKRPFIALNCGAIPTHLFESELFGHVKGSFTGAVSDSKGKFVAAHGGDLFLDEIGEMPLDMQVKLLRALQEKAITPVGSTRTIPVEVRVIAATNRNLEELVREGKFRQDLYFRINQITLKTTPLRHRVEDIVYLAELFANRSRPGSTITSAALRKLAAHKWPGNVRELANTIERACLYARDIDADPQNGLRTSVEITPEHQLLSDLSRTEVAHEGLFPTTADEVTKERYQQCMDWIQRRFFEIALEILKDNDKVIGRLEMSRSYFYQKKKDLGLVIVRRNS
jgi:transcriptional regulator with PAS, ATPase and Fis domain